MSSVNNLDFVALAEPISKILLGEPNQHISSPGELRYGKKGSLSIDLTKGTFFDHEQDLGGGMCELIKLKSGESASQWLIKNGFSQATEQGPVSSAKTEHIYTDEHGEPLYKVTRIPMGPLKTYKQSLFVNGEFISGKGVMAGVKLVPYRLSELVNNKSEPVYIVEGEKNSDRLSSEGLISTTNTGGAGKWRETLNPYFADRDVIIIQDNDVPGKKHALSIANALFDVAKSVKLIDLSLHWPKIPDKGDAVDYLNAGHSIAQLESIAKATPFYGMVSAKDWLSDALITDHMLEHSPPARKMLVEGFLAENVVGIIGSPGGVGKSMFALQLSISVATGMPFFGYEVKQPSKVLYLSAEDDREECWRRLSNYMLNYSVDNIYQAQSLDKNLLKSNLYIKSLVGESFTLTRSENNSLAEVSAEAEELSQIVKQIPDLKLIVVDTYSRFNGGRENSNEDAAQFIKACEQIKNKTGATIIIIAHTRKGSQGDGQDIAGGARFVDASRWGATLHSYLVDSNQKYKSAGMDKKEASKYIRFRIEKDSYKGLTGLTIHLTRSDVGGTLIEGINMVEDIMTNNRLPKAETQYDELSQKLVSFLDKKEKANEPITLNKLKNTYAGKDSYFGVSGKVIADVIEKALDNGLIEQREIKPRGHSLHSVKN